MRFLCIPFGADVVCVNVEEISSVEPDALRLKSGRTFDLDPATLARVIQYLGAAGLAAFDPLPGRDGSTWRDRPAQL